MRYVLLLILIGAITTAVLLWRPEPAAAPFSVSIPSDQTSTTSTPIESAAPALPSTSACADSNMRTFARAGSDERTERYTLPAGDVITLCFRTSEATADYLEAFFIQNGTRGGSIDFLHDGTSAMRIRVRHAGGLTNIATGLSLNQWYQVEFRKSDFMIRWRPEGGSWSASQTFSHVGSGAVSAFELVYGNSGNGDARYSFGVLP